MSESTTKAGQPEGCAPMAGSPCRVWRRRVKGWKMPENTVSVCRPGKWGNPFKVGGVANCVSPSEYYVAASQADAVRLYREFVTERPAVLDEIRRELRGKNLACFCKPGSPCHADVLLGLANAEVSHGGTPLAPLTGSHSESNDPRTK